MTVIDAHGHRHETAGTPGGGQFTGKANSAPTGTIAPPGASPQADGEELQWLLKGDDHEYLLLTATTAADATALGAEVFTSRYGEPYDSALITVIAGFRGEDDDYADDLEWVPGTGQAEEHAYRELYRADP
ncbi:hypothetical protein [Microbacterium sp.]|uniref:hypothetical protein n=1 Tax=Microbacterium sp. TaxID=51671 RepID=UPI003A837913